MSNITLPYTFVNGTIADATQVDADFNALLTGLNSNTRTILTAATTFYVSTTGSDTVTGLDPSHPAATVNYIVNLLQSQYDINGQTVTIQLAGGTYNQSILVNGPFLGAVGGSSVSPGQTGLGTVIVQGSTGSPSSVVLIGAVDVNHGAFLTLRGMTLQNAGNMDGVSAWTFAEVVVDTCNWNASALIEAGGKSIIWVQGPHTINANTNQFLLAYDNSLLYLSGAITVAAGVTITTFAVADFCSALRIQAATTFAGTNTGARFAASRNSYIINQSAAAIPGVAPADANCTSGGRYHGPDGNFPSVYQVSA